MCFLVPMHQDPLLACNQVEGRSWIYVQHVNLAFFFSGGGGGGGGVDP